MAEQSLDVGRVWAQARRHRRVLVLAVLVGAGLGAGSVGVLPPTYTSESRVLLPPVPQSGGETAERDGRTEVEVARSDVVLGPAGESLSPPATVRQLSEQVRFRALTPDVLQIVAEGRSAARAEAIAAAVAEAELAYLGEAIENRSTTRAAILADRERSLRESLATVSAQIDATRRRRDEAVPGSPAAVTDASALAQLTAEQANLVLALDEVRGLMAGSEPDAPATAIEKASPARRPGLAGELLVRGVVGALVALLVTLLVLVVSGRRDRRLRYRDEVADALGTAVLASVRSRVPRSTAGWTDLLAHYEPGTVDAWALRQVLRQLAVDTRPTDRGVDGAGEQPVPHPASVTVVSLAGDLRGLAMGPQLAAYAASLGVSTRLVAAQGHDSASALWAACRADGRPVEGRSSLVVTTRNSGAGPAELTVVLAVVDPQHPALGELPRTVATVLAVSSASATAEELARAAVTADDAGHRIAGVVLADPDDLDRTTGRALHHERLHQVPLPAHLTGVTPRSRPGSVSGIRERRTR